MRKYGRKRMELISQKMRKLAPELDPLRIGTGWKKEDLDKVQVMVESTYGDSHPGSGHLNLLVEEVRKGIAEEGGYGARYFCTDICDGESQGTDGINYSLASREMIANMIEIHANATPFDAGVYLSSCDKGVPGNLIGMMRVDIPSVFVPGGTMNAGPDMLTLEQLGMYSARYERGEIDEAMLDWAKCNACPSCGACSFIGTASTMQIMAEALGLALPGSALMPSTSPDLLAFAREAGRQAVRLAKMENMKPSDIVTIKSFENAILVHAGNLRKHELSAASSGRSPMNWASRSPVRPLTGCTGTPGIFWMSVRQAGGRQNVSTMREACRRSWKRSGNICIWM